MAYIALAREHEAFSHAQATGEEEVRGQVIKVKPNYQSQICYNFNAYIPKELSERVHNCKACTVVVSKSAQRVEGAVK